MRVIIRQREETACQMVLVDECGMSGTAAAASMIMDDDDGDDENDVGVIVFEAEATEEEREDEEEVVVTVPCIARRLRSRWVLLPLVPDYY